MVSSQRLGVQVGDLQGFTVGTGVIVMPAFLGGLGGRELFTVVLIIAEVKTLGFCGLVLGHKPFFFLFLCIALIHIHLD